MAGWNLSSVLVNGLLKLDLSWEWCHSLPAGKLFSHEIHKIFMSYSHPLDIMLL